MGIRITQVVACFCVILVLSLSGCASSDHDYIKAEQAKQARVKEQQNKAREADYDLQNAVK